MEAAAMNQKPFVHFSTRGKRPLRNLAVVDKVRAIQRIHNGETKAAVSRAIGVPESTLRGWCKNEQKLRFMCGQMHAEMPQQLNKSMADLKQQPSSKIVEEVGGLCMVEKSSLSCNDQSAASAAEAASKSMPATLNANLTQIQHAAATVSQAADLSIKKTARFEFKKAPRVRYKAKQHLPNFLANENQATLLKRPKLDSLPKTKASSSSSTVNAEMAELPRLFSLGLPFPTVPATNLDAEARSFAILQWTRVFNASLNALALAAAVAAIQPKPTKFAEVMSSKSTDFTVNGGNGDDDETKLLASNIERENDKTSNFKPTAIRQGSSPKCALGGVTSNRLFLGIN